MNVDTELVTEDNACEVCNDDNSCIECEKIGLALGLMKISRTKTFLQRHTRKIENDIATCEREYDNWMFLIKMFSFFLVLTQVILILF